MPQTLKTSPRRRARRNLLPPERRLPPSPWRRRFYWAAIGFLGYRVPPHTWIFIAFATSGLIFPLAILLGRICRVDFLRDRTSISDALIPMLDPHAVVLACSVLRLLDSTSTRAAHHGYRHVRRLADYGLDVWQARHLHFSHAIVRAVVCFILWNWFPATRFTLLPIAVSIIYLATIAVILVASSNPRGRLTSPKPPEMS